MTGIKIAAFIGFFTAGGWTVLATLLPEDFGNWPSFTVAGSIVILSQYFMFKNSQAGKEERQEWLKAFLSAHNQVLCKHDQVVEKLGALNESINRSRTSLEHRDRVVDQRDNRRRSD